MLRIDFGIADGWTMEAAYGANNAATVGSMSAAIVARGRLEHTGSIYRLISSTGQSLSFRQLSPTLIHPIDERGQLMLGTSGWSYTLNRADATDDSGRPEQGAGGSRAPLPRASGPTVIGIFEGRTPCTRLLRELRITLSDGCQRLKWRVTLFQDSATKQPTKYRIEGSLHHAAREGTLRLLRGTALDPDAIVYQLDGTATEGPMLLWRASENVLFMLDAQKQPLVGTIDFSYALNRRND